MTPDHVSDLKFHWEEKNQMIKLLKYRDCS